MLGLEGWSEIRGRLKVEVDAMVREKCDGTVFLMLAIKRNEKYSIKYCVEKMRRGGLTIDDD